MKFLSDISTKISYVALPGLLIGFYLMASVPFVTDYTSHYFTHNKAQI